MAARLRSTALEHDITPIAAAAAQLQHAASTNPEDVLMVTKLTNDLLCHCRASQRTYLEIATSETERREEPQTASGDRRRDCNRRRITQRNHRV